jgi:flavodoxin
MQKRWGRIRSASRVAASALGLYAGLLGAAHGVYEILQGNTVPGSVMIQAIGPPCQPERVAHACWPAMTLVPSFLITGILAVFLSLTAATWAAAFVQRTRGGWVLILLSIGMLLVGSGFIPTFVGLIAGVAGIGIHAPLSKWRARLPTGAVRLGSALWPWPLIAYALWVLPTQWLLGRFLDEFLMSAGLILFFSFDLGLPLLAVLTGFARDILRVRGMSKALVVYDSVFGNTEKVAQAMGDALGGEADVQTIRVGEVRPEHLRGLDAVIVGSPTRAFSPTSAIKAWLRGLPSRSLEGARIAAFDTRVSVEDVDSAILTFMIRIFGYAAKTIGDRLARKGGKPAMPPEGFLVEGTEGPLREGELVRAADWARQILPE